MDFDTLDRLERLRRARAMQSASFIGAWGGVEATAGTVLLVTGAAPAPAGLAAVGGGGAHALTAFYASQMAARRYRAWTDRRVALEQAPAEAWVEAVAAFRLAAEREARAHAFATGVYTAVTAVGLATLLYGPKENDLRTLGAVVGGVGAAGFLHHTNRWRFCIRLSVDADGLLRSSAPTGARDPI